jgi:hypothetical protein
VDAKQIAHIRKDGAAPRQLPRGLDVEVRERQNARPTEDRIKGLSFPRGRRSPEAVDDARDPRARRSPSAAIERIQKEAAAAAPSSVEELTRRFCLSTHCWRPIPSSRGPGAAG